MDENINSWVPRTELGRKVLAGEIKSIDEILDKKILIKEPEIVDYLMKDLKINVLNTGKRTGKGSASQRIPVRMTLKVTASGKRVKSSITVVVGNGNGIIGIGRGKSVDTRRAYEMAVRRAKLNLIKVWRGCGSWECNCGEPHSIPFKTYGKCGSVKVYLFPAPRGVGLVCDNESKKVFQLAGIKDIWVKTFGNTPMRINLGYAIIDALKNVYKYNK